MFTRLHRLRLAPLLASALLLPLMLAAPRLSAQDQAPAEPTPETSSEVSGEQLATEAADMSDAELGQEITAWMGQVETLREAAATANADVGEDEPSIAAAAAADDARDAAVAHLETLAEVASDRGLDTAAANALLAESGAISVSTLEVSTLQALADRWLQKGQTWVMDELPGVAARAVAALVVLIAFWFAAFLATRLVNKALSAERLNVSTMLRRFFVSITGKLVMAFGVLFALATLGVQLGPVLAGVGVAGFVIGFALQDTLANFAAGIMILLYRPFEMGHIVTVGGVTGTVNELSLVSTTLLTPDHQRIVMPNNMVWGGMIINMTSQPARRADTTVGISYGDDIDKAMKAMIAVAKAHPLTLETPEMDIIVSNLGDSSVDITARPWVVPQDYLSVTADLRKQFKQRLDEEGITIPFPQRDVHIFKQD